MPVGQSTGIDGQICLLSRSIGWYVGLLISQSTRIVGWFVGHSQPR